MDPETEAQLDAKLERLEKRTCAWCGVWIPYDGNGRPKVYCSKAHRNRAWEVRTAEARRADDLAAGKATAEPVREVVSRPPKAPPAPKVPTRTADWLRVLAGLSEQLREGDFARRFYDHPKLAKALLDALAALDEVAPGGLDELRRRRR